MLRILLWFVIALAIVALLTRRQSARRALWVLLGILGTYAVLKSTGAIEAIVPARDGVF